MAGRVQLDRLAVDLHFNGVTVNQGNGCPILRHYDIKQPISEIDFEAQALPSAGKFPIEVGLPFFHFESSKPLNHRQPRACH